MKQIACFLLIVLLTACGSSPSSSPDVTETAVPAEQPTATPTAVPPTPTPVPTATAPLPPPAPQFVFVGEDPGVPIVTNNPTASIDNSYINPGGIVYHDGEFHMLFNSFTQWPGLVQFGYLTSSDGINWRAVQDEPVFTSDDIPFVRQGADISSLIVDENGKWTAYFHTVNGGPLAAAIGRATADSPLGPWTFDSEPVLEPGERGEWDGNGIAWPSVVKTADGYAMYFAGTNNRRVTRIGLATSSDGVVWQKYNDSATEDAEFANSDPVLTASSEDFPIFGTTWDTTLVYAAGTYFYFMEIGTLAGTDLYLTTHAGNLR